MAGVPVMRPTSSYEWGPTIIAQPGLGNVNGSLHMLIHVLFAVLSRKDPIDAFKQDCRNLINMHPRRPR